MARKVFYSFHFDNDYWRAQQVRNINALEGQKLLTPNAWEEVRKKGEAAIKQWIEDEMKNKTCVVVLIGAKTASRPWVRYEILKGWNDGRGVLGVRIHGLLDSSGDTSTAGPNPFANIEYKKGTLADVAPVANPPGANSKEVYASISANLENWVEQAITIRAKE